MTLAELKGKQSALKGRITNIHNQLTTHATTPLTAARYDQIKKNLAEYLEKCETLNEEIYAKADAAEQAAQQVESDAIDGRIHDLIDQLAKIPHPTCGSGAPPGGPDAGIRLPKMEVPTFSGYMQDWTSFYDLFTATIHNNGKLSKANKLQYLKSSLKGNAATLIQSLQITDANYDEAWTLLSARYDNRREIVHAHLKRLFAQPGMKDESATGLRALIDTTNECIRALKVLNRPVDQWDDMLVFLVTERLDSEARRQWILSLLNDNPPTYADIMKFLDQRARALAEAGESSKPKTSGVAKTGGERKATMAVHHGAFQDYCVSCSGSHTLFRCPEFQKLTVPDRKALVKKSQLCFNCFRGQHNASRCTSGTCRKCGSQHHTLLHSEGKPETVSTSEVVPPPNVKVNFASDPTEGKAVLLSTAIIMVADSTGKLHSCRALLDNASEASLIAEELVHRLGLKRQNTNTFITGVNESRGGMVKSVVQLNASSCNQNYNFGVDALVVRRPTGDLPSKKCDPSTWTHLKSIQMADPTFHVPSKIDILLGADVYADLLRPGLRHGRKGEPAVIHTALGWIVCGRTGIQQQTRVMVNHAQCSLDDTLRKFWELEELPQADPRTPEQISCEQQFENTHTRDDSGRFTVHLPFCQPTQKLGASRDMALRRFKQVERRFISSPELMSQYIEFMDEYERLGHMKVIPQQQIEKPIGSTYYIPHHAVMKNRNIPNKFRVVFDASAKTTSGISLNDTLMVGPKTQDDLFPILFRFRFHKVAICADVGKMYRQIQVHPDDWNFQGILWRANPNQPIKDYWLTTVTYGTASAPYQATKCTQQLAIDEKLSFPLASEIWTRDAYVDDLMTGACNTRDGIKLASDLNEIMRRGGFPLLKWLSNDPAVMESFPPDVRGT